MSAWIRQNLGRSRARSSSSCAIPTEVKLQVKLQQLQHLCAAEFIRLEAELRRGVPPSSTPIPYVSVDSAHHPGAIDQKEWALSNDAFLQGVSAPARDEAGAAQATAISGSSSTAFELRRAVVACAWPANEKLRQQVAWRARREPVACAPGVGLRKKIEPL